MTKIKSFGVSANRLFASLAEIWAFGWASVPLHWSFGRRGVCDGLVWINQKAFTRETGEQLIMPEIVDYCTRALTPEALEFIAFFYRNNRSSPWPDDPVVAKLRNQFGEITVSSVTKIRDNGKETGRMYHLSVAGNKWTAVSDNDSKEICYSSGHVKLGTFYTAKWKTLDGNPAVSSFNRVYSTKYKSEHRGMGLF